MIKISTADPLKAAVWCGLDSHTLRPPHNPLKPHAFDFWHLVQLKLMFVNIMF